MPPTSVLPLLLAMAVAGGAVAADAGTGAPHGSDPGTTAGVSIDPARSSARFGVRMRWLSRVEGRFERFRGEVAALGDGQRRVEVEIESSSLDVGGRRRMTEWAASGEFFDVAHHPVIVFMSDPFDPVLAESGGRLAGDLSLRGTTRRVVFEMVPAGCTRPGHDCPIVVEGELSRGDFGMDTHRMAVQDRVDLRFEVHLQALDADAP